MPYPASFIADQLVQRGIQGGKPLTQMKLQKMLYFAQGIHLAGFKEEPLVKETFQAWKFGPVIPNVYHEYKLYGSQPILDRDWVISSNPNKLRFEKPDSRAEETLERTWNTLKDISAIQLSNWTHQPESPWSRYYIEGVNDQEIPNEEIKEYFLRFFK